MRTAAPAGRLLAEVEEVGDKPGHLWAEEVLAELAALPNVRIMARTTVTGAYDGGHFAALERVGCIWPIRRWTCRANVSGA